MIPDIGLIIGFYVLTRMLSFLTRKGERAESIGVKIFAVITIIITLICLCDLWLGGTTSSQFLKY